MRTNIARGKRKEFTRADLMVIVGILLVFGLSFQFYWPKKHRVRGPHPIRCVNNLKQVGLAFRIFANDHDDRFPFYVTDAIEPHTGTLLYQNGTTARTWMHFQALSNELQHAGVLLCPQDVWRRDFAAVDFQDATSSLSASNHRDPSVSYFVGLYADETRPQSLLAGDRNLAMGPNHPGYSSKTVGGVQISTNSVWTAASGFRLHERDGYVALADGSVLQVSDDQVQASLINSENSTGTASNLFLFPQ